MSKLAKDMMKAGLDPLKSKTAEKKSTMGSVNTPNEIKAHVDEYLKAKDIIDAAEISMKDASGEIVNFAISNALANKSMENIVVDGSDGSVGVVFKDQYSLKDRSELDKLLKTYKLNPDQFIDEKTTLNFQYDMLTEGERTKLFKFLTNELGQDRYAQVVTESTKYSIKGLKDKLATISKNRADFDNLRQVSGMYTPTVAKRKA